MALSSDKNETPLNSYRFGEFELELEEEALFRSGERLNVPRRALQVLRLLLERRGEIVSKDDFFEKVWGGTFVEENNLTVVIASLRKVLGDNAKEAKFIENLPRKGYRFIAPAFTSEVGPAPSQVAVTQPPLPKVVGRRRLVSVAGLAVTIVALIGAVAGFTKFFPPGNTKITSVVVIPFSSTSAGGEYVANGLSEGVVGHLSRAKGLLVIDNRSLRESDETPSNPTDVARELNAAAFVLGQVERDGDALIVSAELRESTTSQVLWQQKFRRRAVDLYSIQNEIAQNVAKALNLPEAEASPFVAQRRQTQDPAAFDLYLRGRHHWNKRTEPDFLRAADLYRQAVERDPTFAAAYVGLAETYSLGRFEVSPEERNAIIRGYIDRALEIDDTISEAYAARAINKCYHDWDLAGAEADYLRAIELNPNNATARHWYAELLAMQGRFEESFIEYERATALDPLSLPIKTDMAFNYFYARDHDTAIALLKKVIDQAPNYQRTYSFLSQVYKEKQMFDEAVSTMEKLDELRSQNGEFGDPQFGFGKRFLARVRPALKESGSHGYWRTEADIGPMDFHVKAVAHAKLGEIDKAFEWLEIGFRTRATGMVWLKVTPDLDGLRSDPRFDELLRRTNLFKIGPT